MTYRQRLSLFVVIDSIIVLTAVFLSWFLISAHLNIIILPVIIGFISVLSSHHFFAVIFKLYRKVWEYASIGELLMIFKVVTYSILVAIVVQQVLLQEIYIRFLIVAWLLHLLFIGGSRFIWRMYRDSVMNKLDNRLRTLVVGAGSAGTMVVKQILNDSDSTLLPVAFIDDNGKKHQLDILGLPVYGGVKTIENAVEELNIDHIIISIPSLGKRGLNIIFQECAKTKAQTKILPRMEDLVTGKISINHFRDVRVEDLLVREPIDLDMDSIKDSITNKVVLVTGAGGSIGSEISRQVSRFHPRQLILLGHGENSIYTIEMELKENFKNSTIQFTTEIADVQNAKKMMDVMGNYRPDIVYHAAAHKHVPLMERNPEEAVKNNVIGTTNIARAASRHHIGTFVMVSTDKAVNPTSVMGATKKLAEMVIQSMNKESQTKFVAVRFGNVLGSHGSVIPLFKRQIEKGGPVTVTHPDMVRYFMTIPEASRLVIQAGALASGGEIFVLDMGDPVKIVELAKNLIKLSGYSIDEIGLEFTGIRPGEKLFEELLNEDEIHEQQLYPNIYIGKTTDVYIGVIEDMIANYINLDKDTLRKQLLYLANHGVFEPQRSVMSI